MAESKYSALYSKYGVIVDAAVVNVTSARHQHVGVVIVRM